MMGAAANLDCSPVVGCTRRGVTHKPASSKLSKNLSRRRGEIQTFITTSKSLVPDRSIFADGFSELMNISSGCSLQNSNRVPTSRLPHTSKNGLRLLIGYQFQIFRFSTFSLTIRKKFHFNRRNEKM
jgi:hypothetical protein